MLVAILFFENLINRSFFDFQFLPLIQFINNLTNLTFLFTFPKHIFLLICYLTSPDTFHLNVCQCIITFSFLLYIPGWKTQKAFSIDLPHFHFTTILLGLPIKFSTIETFSPSLRFIASPSMKGRAEKLISDVESRENER